MKNDIAAELKQASLMLDSRSKEINTICKDIALDTSVQSMMYSQSADVSDNVMLAINVKNGILDRTLLNDFIHGVYIYSKKDNTIVSANSFILRIHQSSYSEISLNRKILKEQMPLINYIKSGKRRQAIDILDDLYMENCKNKDLTYDMLKFFVYDLYCTIIKILGDIKAINSQHVITTIQNMNEHNRNLKDIDFIIKDIKSMIIEI